MVQKEWCRVEWLELIELTEEIVRLRYYPEQKSATGIYGEITYFRKSEDWRFDKIAEGYPRSYAFHACAAAQHCDKINGGKFQKEGLIGWH